MPTENRSSNTEMVSVPEGYMLVERSIWTEQQVEAATACITRLKGVPGMRDCDLAMAAIDAAQCKAPDIALSDLIPAPQPHPEPIAWMVGTAFWWTKEEAERDAAETGLPIVGLGPMTCAAPAEQHQGEPVALQWRKFIRGENEPEPGVEVLVRYARQWPNDKVFFVTGGMLNKAFEGIDTLFWINGAGECMGGTVSHWMPMPNPNDALSASAEPSALPDPLGCNECAHAECGKFDGPRQVECRAMADNACARPGASS